MNKYYWKYNFVAEFKGGGYTDHLVVVTNGGMEYAKEVYRNSMKQWCRDFGKELYYFYFEGKTKKGQHE